MRNLLSRVNHEVLAQLAFSRVLLAFDFDGTLAPIVERPSGARMRRETSTLFARLCKLYPCAVISGRQKADVASRLGKAKVRHVIGNHGLEPGASLEDYEAEIRATKPHLLQALGRAPGVELEDKRYSLALHYRRARQKRKARAAILGAVAALPSAMRVIPGKLVINVVPERAPNKGDALLELRALEHADTALYVGDDVTDEDVFELDQPGRLLTIRVGESQSSAATYFLRDQRAIDSLLARLVALGEERSE
jgi:trehalose 6-phosphate phosphatase